MKKIVAGILLIVNLLTINANAAWEFEEKVIDEADEITVEKDMIKTNSIGYEGNPRDFVRTIRYDVKYFDLKGNLIDVIKEEKNTIYFSNGQVFVKGENAHIGSVPDYPIGNILAYTENAVSYIADQDGREMLKLENYAESISSFSDGIAIADDGRGAGDVAYAGEVGTDWVCDSAGKNIFSRTYDLVERIDNNEFVIKDKSTIKILTAKGIIGEALNTDVKIDINGYKIPCYSAYGYAVIKAEDLRHFGFDVEWDGEERMLYISRNPEYYDITEGDFGESGETGTHYADIYGSDINVEYNGKRLSSYCINGVTLIKSEDLAAEGITFNYDNSQRTLFMDVEGLERK